MTLRLRSPLPFLACTVMTFMGQVVSAAPKRDLPVRTHCPVDGSIYLSRDYDPSRQYGYRLIVHGKQGHAHDMTIDADWTVETFDPRNGKVLSELLLDWNCPAGRGNCQVSPRLLPGKTDYQAVDEVPLSHDFTPASDLDPYAIVIPGFVDWQSGYLDGLRKYGDLRFFTTAHVAPDLSGSLIWVRASCWGKPSGR